MLEVIAMSGPGDYLADETQGITRVEDLPKPKLIRRSRNYKRRPCPLCQHSTYRLRTVKWEIPAEYELETGKNESGENF